MSASLRIAVLPGDGIGPEITAATLSVLESLNGKLAPGPSFEQHPIGHVSLERSGTTFPQGSVNSSCSPSTSFSACLPSGSSLPG